MRSRDCTSAGVCGRVFAVLDVRLEAMLLVMLMNTGEEGELRAFLVVAFGLSTTLGRLRCRIGEGCCGVECWGGVGR